MDRIEKLAAAGCDVESALKRCVGKKDFYLKLVDKSLQEDRFDKTYEVLRSGNQEECFKEIHALKGVVANLSLNPLMDVVYPLMEIIRAEEQFDAEEWIGKIKEARERLL